MHWIEKIEIEGFWDTHKLEVNLFPDVTFFIGPNGTGKTTLINIIAAALLVDFPALDRLPFRQVRLYLAPLSGRKRPTITVSKKRLKDAPYDTIEYRIKDGDENSKFAMEDIGEQMFLSPELYPYTSQKFRFMRRRANVISSTIQSLINVGWLSVHRSSLNERTPETKTFESPVDQKLADLSNELVRYLSSLSKQKDDEVLKFQQNIFLSLLKEDSRRSFDPSGQSTTFSNQRSAIEEIFRELHIPMSSAKSTVNSYFKKASAAFARHKMAGETPSPDDAAILMSLERIQGLIEDWQELGKRLSTIFEQKEKFLSIVNLMLQRKSMEINESNELVFISRSGDLSPKFHPVGSRVC